MIYDVKNLCYHYPTGDAVLKDISFSFHEGEILSILGPNGAGKSTLLNCLAGLFEPVSGAIFLTGAPLKGMSAKEIAKKVGYVRQSHTPAFSYTVLHFVVMGCAAKIGLFGKPTQANLEEGYRVLEQLGIAHLAQRPYTDISGGERQQVTIARAIMQQPKVLLFDEPTSHLDFGNQIKTLNLVNTMAKNGYSVIMTTHNPDHALLLGGKVAILDKSGHLLYGDAKDVVTEEALRSIYNADICLLDVPKLARTVCVTPGLA